MEFFKSAKLDIFRKISSSELPIILSKISIKHNKYNNIDVYTYKLKDKLKRETFTHETDTDRKHHQTRFRTALMILDRWDNNSQPTMGLTQEQCWVRGILWTQ